MERGRKKSREGKNPERTRANIIEVATAEFAERGLSGARVDRIAERTRTSKRMLYYYFGSKEGLYRAVLLSYYEKLRSAEAALDLTHRPPLTALKMLVEFTFDYHLKHAAIVRLVMVENIHKGRHIARLSAVTPLNSSILNTVADILKRGQADGSMRAGLDAFDLYSTIAALCFFNVSNRYTIRAIFQHDMGDSKEIAPRRQAIWEIARRYVSN
ncbi:MAG TPA: TetR/AcrR family transcriptional regulator [Rhizomicrobium sp.]|nr:TetR/AcrR family transcriptional regulator [Rhizomicrobium sp.]